MVHFNKVTYILKEISPLSSTTNISYPKKFLLFPHQPVAVIVSFNRMSVSQPTKEQRLKLLRVY